MSNVIQIETLRFGVYNSKSVINREESSIMSEIKKQIKEVKRSNERNKKRG
jgi:hypothetical protein